MSQNRRTPFRLTVLSLPLVVVTIFTALALYWPPHPFEGPRGLVSAADSQTPSVQVHQAAVVDEAQAAVVWADEAPAEPVSKTRKPRNKPAKPRSKPADGLFGGSEPPGQPFSNTPFGDSNSFFSEPATPAASPSPAPKTHSKPKHLVASETLTLVRNVYAVPGSKAPSLAAFLRANLTVEVDVQDKGQIEPAKTKEDGTPAREIVAVQITAPPDVQEVISALIGLMQGSDIRDPSPPSAGPVTPYSSASENFSPYPSNQVPHYADPLPPSSTPKESSDSF